VRIAVSGHRGLDDTTTRLVDEGIRAHLATIEGDLVGLSCLADGADQIFARAVLDAGGKLVAVVPAVKYRDSSLPESAHAEYDDLLARAVDVHRLDHIESTSESHMDASRLMLRAADVLLAVWDGEPARGYGGTADVVYLAREMGLSVARVWPDGASR